MVGAVASEPVSGQIPCKSLHEPLRAGTFRRQVGLIARTHRSNGLDLSGYLLETAGKRRNSCREMLYTAQGTVGAGCTPHARLEPVRLSLCGHQR